jgi:hypothetical protein
LDGSAAPSRAPAQPLAWSDAAIALDTVIDRWAGAGLAPEIAASLRRVELLVTNLPDDKLALALPGAIVLDIDAAGIGWYVDRSPSDDDEFWRDPLGTLRGQTDASARHVDLLTVIAHELGHLLGASHAEHDSLLDDLMASRLGTGLRRLPDASDLDSIFASTEDLGDLFRDMR